MFRVPGRGSLYMCIYSLQAFCIQDWPFLTNACLRAAVQAAPAAGEPSKGCQAGAPYHQDILWPALQSNVEGQHGSCEGEA